MWHVKLFMFSAPQPSIRWRASFQPADLFEWVCQLTLKTFVWSFKLAQKDKTGLTNAKKNLPVVLHLPHFRTKAKKKEKEIHRETVSSVYCVLCRVQSTRGRSCRTLVFTTKRSVERHKAWVTRSKLVGNMCINVSIGEETWLEVHSTLCPFAITRTAQWGHFRWGYLLMNLLPR